MARENSTHNLHPYLMIKPLIALRSLLTPLCPGKSSLLKRFSDDEFELNYSSTIGVDFEVRTITVGSKRVKLQMWDTAGQERFRTITTSYYRGAHAVIIVCDVTHEESFQNISKWIKELEMVNAASIHQMTTQMLLVANKVDLVRQRVVESHRLEKLSEQYGIPYIETSAKNNENVLEAFQLIGANFVAFREKEEREGRWIGAPGGPNKNVKGISLEEDEEASFWKKCTGGCSIM